MPDHSCPNCARPVEPAEPACPSCGANLGLTVPGTPAPEAAAEPRRGVEFTPGQRFAGRFTIIERVGAGGMGVVYKAIDTALDSQVGLKVIRSDLAEIPTFALRFRREVRLTRQITHANVCRVHDIGEQDGVLYLSMEWIEGETLEQLLRQAGTLRDVRALEIACRIAAALDAAHTAGVIHRDLKPGNVMIDRRGKVSVLDFGLALEHGSAELTGPGLILGTPRYMAPEQRAGLAVDARADLYALGLVLVQMLVGEPAGSPGTPVLPPEVNPAFLPVLRKLLAEDPRERYPSAAAALEDLRALEGDPAISTFSTVVSQRQNNRRRRGRMIAGAAVLGVALVAAAVRYWPPPPPDLGPDFARGILYLDRESETLSGIENAILAFHLAHSKNPGSAVVQARLSEAYWLRFGRDGSVAAREEAERWAERAAALDSKLPELGNARALGLFYEGKLDAAKTELDRVLADHPKFEPALLTLGLVERDRGDHAAALAALERAEKLAPLSFRVQIALGRLHQKFGEYDLAVRAYRRAIDLKPDSAIAWNNLSTTYLQQNRLTEAAEALERSIAIDEYADARSNLGTLYYMLGRYDDAITQYRRATELEPDRAIHYGNLGDALLKAGRKDESRQAYITACGAVREQVVREPLSLEAQAEAALLCAQAGESKLALGFVAQVGSADSVSAELVLECAAALAAVEHDGEALDWLERAIRLGASRTEIDNRPELDRFAGNPRFDRLLELAR